MRKFFLALIFVFVLASSGWSAPFSASIEYVPGTTHLFNAYTGKTALKFSEHRVVLSLDATQGPLTAWTHFSYGVAGDLKYPNGHIWVETMFNRNSEFNGGLGYLFGISPQLSIGPSVDYRIWNWEFVTSDNQKNSFRTNGPGYGALAKLHLGSTTVKGTFSLRPKVRYLVKDWIDDDAHYELLATGKGRSLSIDLTMPIPGRTFALAGGYRTDSMEFLDGSTSINVGFRSSGLRIGIARSF